ncbi:MAG: hypothetical protein AB7I50_22395 [Vicinamibacterales bacterium]
MTTRGAALRLHTALKRYPHTAPLIDGVVADSRIELDCELVEPIFRAFAPMARRQTYDVSEMAIVTVLQAMAYEKPLVVLPVVVASRLQQKCLVYNRRHRVITIDDLPGARVGVRAYTQTTGMWVRAILAGTYGIATERIRWMTFEEGHLAEYEDPPFVTRMPEGASMIEMLRAGDLDAAIFGNDLPREEGIEPVIARPADADRAWYESHGFVPINHVVVMKRSVAEAHPDGLAALYELLKRGKRSVPEGDVPNALPDGIDAMRRPLEATLAACAEQRLLPRPLSVDEVFADTVRLLGEAVR